VAVDAIVVVVVNVIAAVDYHLLLLAIVVCRETPSTLVRVTV
jgi:hypothetical protein